MTMSLNFVPKTRHRVKRPGDLHLDLLTLELVRNVVVARTIYFSGFLFWGCHGHGQVGGTRFQIGMTGADQRRYLRPDE